MLNKATGGMIAIALSNAILFSGLTGVSIALPVISDDLRLDSSTLHWVSIGAFLPMASFSIVAGRLGDSAGRRLFFLIGLSLFGLASGVCAVSPNSSILIAGRIFQGVGCALAVPLSFSNLTVIYPPQRHGWAFGIVAAITTLSGTTIPFLLSFIIDRLGWRFTFALYFPLIIALILLAMWTIPESKGKNYPRFDTTGCILLAVGLCLLVVACERWADWGVANPRVITLLVAACLTIAAFYRHELHAEFPLLDFRALKLAPVIVSLILLAHIQCTSLVITFNLPIFLQQVERLSPYTSSAALAAGSIGTVLFSSFAGRVADHGKTQRIISLGMAAGVAAILLLGYGLLARQYSVILLGMIIFGFCPALIYAPATAIVVSRLGAARRGISTALTVESRQLGSTVGFASCQALIAGAEWLRRRRLLGVSRGKSTTLDQALYSTNVPTVNIAGHSRRTVERTIDSTFTLGFSVILLLMSMAILCLLPLVFRALKPKEPSLNTHGP
ncbi:MFS transporter [Streptomyces sp. NPDC048419]|uniref:MFS transporter n=1 Tax=Streptomyces sp. NPDC048419 TaxID=3365547 RepID=UPI003721E48A